MYTREQKEKALAIYDTTQSITEVIRRLGYPSKQALYTWIANRDIRVLKDGKLRIILKGGLKIEETIELTPTPAYPKYAGVFVKNLEHRTNLCYNCLQRFRCRLHGLYGAFVR